MPEYLAPGVFVEETSYRAKSIEGVGTSVAALIGPTRTGPLRGVPEVVTSFAEFSRVFGDAKPLNLAGQSTINHCAIAAKAFFDNGGKQLFVSRVVKDVNAVDENGDGSTATRASVACAADGTPQLTFSARFPGEAGRVSLELVFRDSENLLRVDTLLDPGSDVVVLTASDVPKTAFKSATLADAQFPVRMVALVEKGQDDFGSGNEDAYLVLDGTRLAAWDKDDNPVAIADLNASISVAQLPANATLRRTSLKVPADGPLSSNPPMVLHLTASDASVGALTGNLGTETTLFGTYDSAQGVITFNQSLNPNLGAATVAMPVAAIAALKDHASFMMVQRRFDIDVLRDGERIHSYVGCTSDTSGDSALSNKMPASPPNKTEALTSPVSCTIAGGATSANILVALLQACSVANMKPNPLEFKQPRYLIALTGGSDGEAPLAVDYAGEGHTSHPTGLVALEQVDDVSMVITPNAATLDDTGHKQVIAAVQAHCRKMRYRVGIVDARQGMSLSEVRELRSAIGDDRGMLAMYYPWVATIDPTQTLPEVLTPPSGFIAGIYAHTDVARGVHKAPANEVVLGATRFEVPINQFQQELLNPNGINCLRSFPNRGHRVWGGRTLSTDPEWKYVNVRRYFLYLERSIEKSTQWVVFEPNGEDLWRNVADTIDSFLYNEWSEGHLLGASPEAAYFVRCDRSTMTQNDIDNGRLVCEIGVAPLRPAEFVIFRIGQKTAEA